MAKKSFSNLQTSSAYFNEMLSNFAVTTVMNAKVYNYLGDDEGVDFSKMKVNEIIDLYTDEGVELCELKYLKTSTATTEGPTKTVTGGQDSKPLVKYGKTARLEMQNALGSATALDAICGGIVEYFGDTEEAATALKADTGAIHVSTRYSGPKTIIGESFFIDQASGAQVPVKIIFYYFLPDSQLTFTMDAEGDATVFDLNGDLGATKVLIGVDGQAKNNIAYDVFYSIVPAKFDEDKLVDEEAQPTPTPTPTPTPEQGSGSNTTPGQEGTE